MALEVKKLDRPPGSPASVVEAEERLWLTADKEGLVPDGHADAAFLFCAPGQPIPIEEAERYGLVKRRAKAEDKRRAKAEDKGE